MTRRFLPATATPARRELHRLPGSILSGGTDNGTDALDGGTLRVVKEVCVSMRGGRIRVTEQRADEGQAGATRGQLGGE